MVAKRIMISLVSYRHSHKRGYRAFQPERGLGRRSGYGAKMGGRSRLRWGTLRLSKTLSVRVCHLRHLRKGALPCDKYWAAWQLLGRTALAVTERLASDAMVTHDRAYLYFSAKDHFLGSGRHIHWPCVALNKSKNCHI